MSDKNRAPWHVLHGPHIAWRQRAFMVGDFAPGKIPAAWYVVGEDGRAADPLSVPKCETCSAVPATDTLTVVEVLTGDRSFLERARQSRRWPKPTDPETCWWCNCAGAEMANALLCVGCEAHLRKE